MVTRAGATYGDGAGRRVTLEMVDTGGASGLMGLASWAGIEGQRENDQMSERTERVGNRMVHERVSRVGGTNEFDVFVGDRFIVSADGGGVTAAELRDGVLGLDLSGLESMRNAGLEE